MGAPDPIRVQKYLADCGYCSRRKAEQLIMEARVTVNGAVIELGSRVVPGSDVVVVDGQRVRMKQASEAKPVLLLNKPRGYVCTNEDPFAEKTVFDLLPIEWRNMRLFCAGRLDKDSEGMVILTSDGELANRIMHPSSNVVKRYRVLVNRPFDRTLVPNLLRGIVCDGERLKAEKIIPATVGPEAECRLEIHLVQGRKREIRRMLQAVGFFVKRLKRFQIGGLRMRFLPRGSVRELSQKEVSLLVRPGNVQG